MFFQIPLQRVITSHVISKFQVIKRQDGSDYTRKPDSGYRVTCHLSWWAGVKSWFHNRAGFRSRILCLQVSQHCFGINRWLNKAGSEERVAKESEAASGKQKENKTQAVKVSFFLGCFREQEVWKLVFAEQQPRRGEPSIRRQRWLQDRLQLLEPKLHTPVSHSDHYSAHTHTHTYMLGKEK